MWVSSMTSPHPNGAASCGGHSQSITQNLPNRQCSQCRLAATTMHSTSKMSSSSSSSLSALSTPRHRMQFTLHRAIYVFAAISLLNTVGLFSVALADTMQYPVTASIGGTLIPPGTFNLLYSSSSFFTLFVLICIVVCVTTVHIALYLSLSPNSFSGYLSRKIAPFSTTFYIISFRSPM